jgi:hypothetical protein
MVDFGGVIGSMIHQLVGHDVQLHLHPHILAAELRNKHKIRING